MRLSLIKIIEDSLLDL